MSRILFAAAILVGLSTLTVAQAKTDDAELQKGEDMGPERVKLTPQEGAMSCLATVPILEGQRFMIVIPENLSSSEGMISRHHLDEPHWDAPYESGAVGYRLVKEGKVDYSVKLTPGVDFVDVTITVKNLSEERWTNLYSFNCLHPINAPRFKDWRLERTYMSKDGKPFRMDGTTRINEGPQPYMKTLQFYLHEDYDNVSPSVTQFRSTSPDRTDGSYIVTLSEDGDAYMAATSPKALFLFDNLDRCCIHSAPTLGDVDPGEEASVQVRLYLAKGSLEDFLARYFADFPEAKPSAKEKVELAGLPAPERGKRGRLAFRIRPPWMKEGGFVLRAPETLHTSLGLMFIDHNRQDMPPIFELDPFPEWNKDESGTVWYTYRAENDVEFGCRAVPGEDEVDVTYTVRNHRDEDIGGIYPQMCLNLSEAPGFGKKLDVSRTFVRIEGEWTPLTQTHPGPDEVDRPPWMHVNTKATGPWRQERTTQDGWWVVEELCDIPMTAMVDESGEHLVAITWERGPGTSTNSRIPCLHAGPPHAGRCPAGESVTFHGKIYLIPADFEMLDRRYESDFGELGG